MLYKNFGALHYLRFTHPKLAYNVQCVSKFRHQLNDTYWQAMKSIRDKSGSPNYDQDISDTP
jgi:hypothetical protein